MPAEVGDGPAGLDAQRAMRETLTLIEAAQEQVDAAVRTARDRAQREYTGHDPGRHVTVRVGGSGALLHFETDEAFLRRVQDDYVNRAVGAAVADAYRNVDAPSGEADPGDAMRELRALTNDPGELLRRLFGYR